MNKEGKEAELCDYQGLFDPRSYLTQIYRQPGTPENRLNDFRLDRIHEMFEGLYPSDTASSQQSCRILDYGCGPVTAYVISAAGKAQVSEVVLAEYTSKNRASIQQWLDKDPSAFDWSPYFNYVVKNLEGKSEREVICREERLRSLVKVASCDITLDQPIEKGYEGPYDVLMTMISIESACKSENEYSVFIERLSHLVKPGGRILLFNKLSTTVSQPMYVTIGKEDFYCYVLSCDAVTNALKQASFIDIATEELSIAEIMEGVRPSEYASIDTHWYTDSFYYKLFTATKAGPDQYLHT